MDFISLANLSYIKVGDPKNTWQRKFNRTDNNGMGDGSFGLSDDFGVSSVNMKPNAGEIFTADKKSVIFSDIMRAAYARKMSSNI